MIPCLVLSPGAGIYSSARFGGRRWGCRVDIGMKAVFSKQELVEDWRDYIVHHMACAWHYYLAVLAHGVEPKTSGDSGEPMADAEKAEAGCTAGSSVIGQPRA